MLLSALTHSIYPLTNLNKEQSNLLALLGCMYFQTHMKWMVHVSHEGRNLIYARKRQWPCVSRLAPCQALFTFATMLPLFSIFSTEVFQVEL